MEQLVLIDNNFKMNEGYIPSLDPIVLGFSWPLDVLPLQWKSVFYPGCPHKDSVQIQMWRRAKHDSRVLMMTRVKYCLAETRDKRAVSDSEISDNLKIIRILYLKSHQKFA